MKTVAFTASRCAGAWYLVDAKGLVLGRMAARVAAVLRGKHRAQFTPNQDMGDHVVVVNAADVVLTGNKIEKKRYYRHSGYIGGLKETAAKDLLRDHPDRLVTFAIEGMLPKTKLGNGMTRKLRVYAGGEHPHQAQHLVPLEGLEDARPNLSR